MAKFRTKTFFHAFFWVFGALLFVWVLYLANYAFFCRWHFADSEARFLVLGDPQMEGDSRIIRQGFYGHLDLWHNDAYFRHIVSTIVKYLGPTHVFVLGDLFSSQYVTDAEFQIRLARYRYIFDSVTVPLYNITGNHDIGYAGEVTAQRLRRFENAFGKVNDQLIVADHLIGIVNAVNIDDSYDKSLQDQTWNHMRNISAQAKELNIPLVMMMHIPLHKEAYSSENFENVWARGLKDELCTDRSYTIRNGNGHINVQNMILPESTQMILQEMQPTLVFNGHDHDGCIYRHNQKTVEYTVRSMMGGFGGYAGLFEIRRNHNPFDNTPFSYHFTPCPFVSTRTTTITFVVFVVYVFVVSSVLLYNTMLQNSKYGREVNHAVQKSEEFVYGEQA